MKDNENYKIVKINNSSGDMKKYVYFLFALLATSLIGMAQNCRVGYGVTATNTACGGTVKVTLASADASCITSYRAVLFDSAGVENSREAFDSTGKAEFRNLSSGNYKVKIIKTDGSDTHPTETAVNVTATYVRFSVDMTDVTQVAATGECASDGKVTLKIKDGAGPFVVKFYEQGSTTPVATSAPTNKLGNLTPVEVSGLKSYTKYDVEVTDEIGNMGCGITEPKNVRSVITNSASGSFIRNISLDTWRPKKTAEPTRVASGFVTVEIDNAKAGAGPFTVTITNHDTGVTVATQSINKAAGASTTAYITPSGSQKFEGNNRYNIKVTDGSCTKTKQMGYSYGYSSRALKLFLVPSLSCTNCNLFDFAFAADYTHEGARPNYYPFLITVKIQRGGTTLPLIQYTNSEALSKNRVGKYHIYGNNEFGFWNWWDPMVYKVGTQIRVGDVITVTYEDSNNVTRTETHTVSPPTTLPVTRLHIGPKSGGGPCDKIVLLKTYLQTGHGGAYYNAFCNTAGIKYRVKVGGSWVVPPAGNTSQSGSLFRYFNEVNNNEHVITVQNALASTYQVEYAGVTGSLNGSTTKDCKHYLSQQFTSANVNAINPLADLTNHISVGGTPSQTLERNPTGNKVYVGSSDPDYTGLKFITATNKLTVKLERLDNSGNVINGKVTMNVTGPWNLAGNYTVTFPFVKQVWPGNNNGTDYIYQFIDLPVGKYKVTFSDQCTGRPAVSKVIDLNGVPSPSHTLDMAVSTSCASGGGTSKGTVTFAGSTLKNYTAGFSGMYVYKDLNNGNSKIHLR